MIVVLEPVVAETFPAHPLHLDGRLVDAAVAVGDAAADDVVDVDDVDAWVLSLHLGSRLVDAVVVVAAVVLDVAHVAADVVAVVDDAAVAVDVAQVAAGVHRSPDFHQSSLQGTAGSC